MSPEMCRVCETPHPTTTEHPCAPTCRCRLDVAVDLFGEPVSEPASIDGWPAGMTPFDVGERLRQEWTA
jgi:hypothetical protein